MARGRARDHEKKRASIRKGAARFFAAEGFDRASMAGAARECGVSKALLYHYYESKETLLFDILDTHLGQLAEVMDAVAADTPEAELRALIHAILETYRDADAEHRLQLEAMDALPDEMRQRLVGHQRRMIARMSRAVARIVPPETDATRLRALTMTVFAILNWFYLWHRPGKGLSRAEYADLATEFVLGGLARAAGEHAAPVPARRQA